MCAPSPFLLHLKFFFNFAACFVTCRGADQGEGGVVLGESLPSAGTERLTGPEACLRCYFCGQSRH